jgi:anti-sigma28 factor (negative regulator of flagellin synthesis)
MDMKVYDRNLTGAAAAGSTRTQDTQKVESSPSGGAQSSSRSSAGDQVELSGTLGRLSEALSTQGTQRTAKVAALAAAYRSGNYQPNAAGASKGLVSEALSAAGGQ